MARSGITTDESIECVRIGAGVASERLLGLGATEYRAVSVGAGRFQFSRTYRPTWAVVVGFVLLPVVVGLFFFLIRSTETWTATIHEDHRRTTVHLSGAILPSVLLALREALAAGPDAPTAMAPTGGVAAVPVPTPPGIVASAPRTAPLEPAPGAPSAFSALPPPPAAAALPPPPAAAVLPPPPPGGLLAPPPPPSSPAPPPAVAGTPAPVSAAGLPAPSVVPPPRTGTSRQQPPAEFATPPAAEGLDEQTRLPEGSERPTRRLEPTTLTFDTGEVEAVRPLLLIGRAPAASDGDHDPVLVAIDDPERSVSKTHLAVRRAEAGLWVLDRGSTNGSVAIDPAGVETVLAPRVAMQVQVGWTVRFGKRSFVVS